MKIATHNSVTGEASATWLDVLLVPFARCQSKTIREQYEAGCRYFDVRYKYSDRKGYYVCAHGLWESKRSLRDVIQEIDELGGCYVMVTCESGAPLMTGSIRHMVQECTNTTFTYFNRKKPKWRIDYCNKILSHVNGYTMLGWQSWHTLIPIPWLWAKLRKKEYNEEMFTFVDFL